MNTKLNTHIIDIVIGTFGTEDWFKKGKKLCTKTKKLSGINKVHHCHGETLASARNSGAENSKADYLIFLDADDYLDDDYVISMHKAAEPLLSSSVIFQPATMFFSFDESVYKEAHIIPDRDMFIANNLVIGSMVGREDFLSVGGFKELPVLEDWELFLNIITGRQAVVKQVPDAIYNVRISNGRNMTKDNTHIEIRKNYANLRRKYLI